MTYVEKVQGLIQGELDEWLTREEKIARGMKVAPMKNGKYVNQANTGSGLSQGYEKGEKRAMNYTRNKIKKHNLSDAGKKKLRDWAFSKNQDSY